MILPNDIFGLLAVLFSLSVAAAVLETTNIGKRVSGVSLVMIGALAASFFGIIPSSAPLYDVIWTYLIPLAIALFLLKANLIKVFAEGGRVLIAFCIGGAGVIAGAILGAFTLDLGTDEAAIAAVYSATYIGGSLNFVAVAEAVQFNDSTQLAAALAIDNILGTGYVILMNLFTAWALLQRFLPWRSEHITSLSACDGRPDAQTVTLPNLLSAIALASVIVALSAWAATKLGLSSYTLLFITILTTAVATAFRKRLARLQGEEIIAMIFMYLFFAIIGVGADIKGMMDAAPELFIIVIFIFTLHLMAMLLAGVFLKLNYAELIIASLACIAGPPVAAAIAILMKWRNLVAPGVLAGVLGYVVGNFVGIAIFRILRDSF